MNRPYCLPIIESDRQVISDLVKKHHHEYRYFEVWVDYIEGPQIGFIQDLAGQLSDKLIIVFRRQLLEPIRMPLDMRFQILDVLNGSGTLADLDVTSQQAELEYLTTNNSAGRTIVSYHDYQQTPDDDALHDVLQHIRKYNPTILKIATMCQKESDALRLLNILLELRNSGQKCIILGMGDHGAIVRVFGSLWGNEIIFAPAEPAGASAPGQLTRFQMEKILGAIGA